MTQVVILVPGIMGSELRLDGDLIWPGSLASLKLPYTKMTELMRPDLVATDVIRKVGIFAQYSSLIGDLNTCGFTESGDRPTLYVFPYDWRKSNAEAATRLAKLIGDAYQKHDSSAEFTFLAHSMGGLVCRYYLESGQFSQNPAFASVKALITMGTPHRGAALALTAAAGEEKRLFLSKSQVLQLASDPRYPSTYELLPPQAEPFAWGDETGRFSPENVFDPATAAKVGLIPANLAAAAAFQSKLDLSRKPPSVRYFCFYGTRQVTSARVELQAKGSTLNVRAYELPDSGDGTVPVWSAQLQGIQGQPVGGEHGSLFRNGDLRRTLAVLLGVPGKLAPEFRVELSVTPKVVEPQSVIHATLLFPDGVTGLDGVLRMERLNTDDAGQLLGKTPIGKKQQIRYSGDPIDQIGTMILAPDLTGFFEVVFEDASAGVEARDDVIVQA